MRGGRAGADAPPSPEICFLPAMPGAMTMRTRSFLLATLLLPQTALAGGALVGDFVWYDYDADGVQDVGEPGLQDITVQLWNEAINLLLAQDTTDANGLYLLQAPSAGNYRVRVLLPPGDQFSPKDAAGNTLDSDVHPSGATMGFTDAFALGSAGSVDDVDAGIVRAPIPLGDRVWSDIDGNGVQDPGEPGIAAITVQLWNGAKTQLIDSAATASDGSYEIHAPLPGSYRVRVIKPSLDAFSPKNAGGSGTQDSDINPGGANAGFTDALSIDAARTDIDAGIADYGIDVGDFVWSDRDEDGLQDGHEPGAPAVVVQLWNDERNALLQQTTTDALGHYALTHIAPGSYRVRVIVPIGHDGLTVKDHGSDAADSDFNPAGPAAGFTDTLVLGADMPGIVTIDAGLTWDPMFSDGFE